MSKYCPKCGEELVDDAKFCKNCGSSLNVTPTPSESNHTYREPAVENKHNAAVIAGYIMAILIPLIGFIIAAYLLTRNSQYAKKHGKYILAVGLIVWILSIIMTM